VFDLLIIDLKKLKELSLASSNPILVSYTLIQTLAS